MRWIALVSILLASLWAGPGLAACAVTHNFVAGNTAVADDVDTNFTDLRTCIETLQARDTIAEHESVDTVNVLLETEIDASSELLALMDDETGTGALVFGTSPTLTTPAIGAATATTASASDNDTSVATTAFVQTEITARGLASSGQTDDRLVKTNGTAGDIEGTGIAVDSSNNMTVPGSITTGGTEVPSCFVLRNRADSGNVACDVNGTTFTCEADTNGVCNDAT